MEEKSKRRAQNSLSFEDFLKNHEKKLVFLLLFIFSILSFGTILHHSTTYDESKHLLNSYIFLKTGECCLHDETPLQIISSIPLISREVNTLEYETLKSNPLWTDFFLFQRLNKTNWDELLVLGRFGSLFVAIILGFYLYRWAKELFGIKSGFFGLFIYIFTTEIIAHSAIISGDIIITATTFIMSYYLWKLLKNTTAYNLLLLALWTGFVLISKISGFILLVPLVFILGYYYCKGSLNFKRIRKLKDIEYWAKKKSTFLSFIILFLIFLLLVLFVLNASYLFKGTFNSLEDMSLVSSTFRKMSSNGFISSLPLPFPRGFIKAVDYQFFDIPRRGSKVGMDPFLFGSFKQGGWWYYYCVALLIKLPLAILILFFLKLVFIRRFWLKYSENQKKAAIIILVIAGYYLIFMSLFNRYNIGVRYVLPVVPFIVLFVSDFGSFSSASRNSTRIVKGLVILFGLWVAVVSLLTFPFYLSYFNEAVGGSSNGWKYLIDSNIDWGQNDYLLREYIYENNLSHVTIKSFWPVYGLNYDSSCDPKYGLNIISVNAFWGLSGWNSFHCYDWLRKPTSKLVGNIGYSWLIFNNTFDYESEGNYIYFTDLEDWVFNDSYYPNHRSKSYKNTWPYSNIVREFEENGYKEAKISTSISFNNSKNSLMVELDPLRDGKTEYELLTPNSYYPNYVDILDKNYSLVFLIYSFEEDLSSFNIGLKDTRNRRSIVKAENYISNTNYQEEWVEVRIPLSVLQKENQRLSFNFIKGISITSNNKSGKEVFYLDNIRIEKDN